MERWCAKSAPKEKFSSSGNPREVERIRGGGREDETVRSLCWCDGGLVLSWSSDGEQGQSVRCGHDWTTGALHECSFFFFFTVGKGNADVHTHYI